MIEQFFSPGAKLGHKRAGPLGAHIDGFADFLSSQGYSTDIGQRKIKLVADLSARLDQQALGVADLDEKQIGEFLTVREKRRCSRRGDRWATHQLLDHLRQTGGHPRLSRTGK